MCYSWDMRFVIKTTERDEADVLQVRRGGVSEGEREGADALRRVRARRAATRDAA